MDKIYQKSFLCGKTAGFTLIELLVVVLIIGILAAVAVPQYQKAVAHARAVEGRTNLVALSKAQGVYYMANADWTEDLSKLDVQLSPDAGEYYCVKVAKKPPYLDCGVTIPHTQIRFLFQVTPSAIYQRCVAKSTDIKGQQLCLSMGAKFSWEDETGSSYYDLI